MKRFLTLCLALCGAMPTLAGPPRGGAVVATYTGPGDIQALGAFGGVRAYSSTVALIGTQAMFNVVRASDSEACDFIVAANGGVGNSANCTGADNGKSLATFLTSTTGVYAEFYDQTGNAHHWPQGTSADRPAVTLGCANSQPCGAATSNVQNVSTTGNITPATGVVSLYVVANRASGTTSQIMMSENTTNSIRGVNGVATSWSVGNGTTSITATGVTANTFHAACGILNGASSSITIDNGSATTGSVTGTTTAAKSQNIAGGNSATLEVTEWGWVDNVAITTCSSLNSNALAWY